MEDLPADLKAFLLNHPYLQLTDNKRIKCTLNGHEFPCDLAELQRFTSGNKYKKLCSGTEFNYSQYEPHIVQSSKQPLQFFCKLTLRHLNRQPHHVLKHVNGKRFKKALGKLKSPEVAMEEDDFQTDDDEEEKDKDEEEEEEEKEEEGAMEVENKTVQKRKK
ncbi:hypothetical protein CRUP_013248, partial [Coryphaenoides rupestris]